MSVGARNVPLGQLEAKLPATVKNKARAGAAGLRQRRAARNAPLAMAKKLGYEQAQARGRRAQSLERG